MTEMQTSYQIREVPNGPPIHHYSAAIAAPLSAFTIAGVQV